MGTLEQEARAFKFRKPKPPVVTRRESDIVNDCIRYLWDLGLKVRRNNSGTYRRGDNYIRYGGKGEGDILGRIKPYGRYLEVECKRPGEKQDADQLDHQKQVEADGGLYIVATCIEDLETRRHELTGRAVWTAEGWI